MEAIKKIIKKFRLQARILNSSFVIRHSSSKSSRGGSALILVVVLTVLLALIGAMFILMSRIDEMATKSLKPDRQLDAAVEAVVDRFLEVVVEDLYGTGSSPFRFDSSDPGSNEPWDYPSADDPWLACLEPVDLDPDPINLQPGFRRITNLYNLNVPAFGNLAAEIIADDAPAAMLASADADGDGVSDSRWVMIPYMTTEKGEKIYAAVRIIDNGGMINPNTAYRNPELISNPGRWDGSLLSHVNLEGITDPDPTLRYDAALIQRMRYGTVLSSAGAADFYSFINDIEYEANAGRRLNNPIIFAPGEMYLPFDVGDELELRNRFFLSTSFGKTGTESRLYQDGDAAANPQALWRITFNPQADPGKGLPYEFTTDPIVYQQRMDAWYAKVGPDGIGSSNRRHYTTVVSREKLVGREYDPANVTVYPASMDATPLNEEQKIGITLPLEIQDGTASAVVKDNFIKRLAMGIYRGLPEENSPAFTPIEDRFGTDSTNNPFYTREQLAWQTAVNMVDYQDKDPLGEETITEYYDEATKTTYYGTESLEFLKKNTVCISKVGYADIKNGTDKGDYYGIEVFNPDDDTTVAPKDLSDYKIVLASKKGNIYEYVGEFDLSDDVEDSGSTDGANDTRVFAFNDSNKNALQTESALNAIPTRMTFIDPYSSGDFSASTKNGKLMDKGDMLIVFNKVLEMPVDCVILPAAFKAGVVVRRRVVLPGTNFLIPATADADVWESHNINAPPAFGIQLGSPIDPQQDDPDNPTAEELIEPEQFTGPDSADVQDLQLAGAQLAETDQMLSNIGEIENVLAVGTRYMIDDKGTPANKNDDEYECTTLIQAIIESYVALTGAGSPGFDVTADQEAGIDMKSCGRIRLNDTDFAGLLDSLTFFDPARDGVDLHNILEDPAVAVTITGTIDGGTADTLTDGEFFSADTAWDSGTVYWSNPAVTIEIDLGASREIWGVIVQADYNDEYVMEYFDGASWQDLLTIENHDPLGALPGGMQTRPDVYDDGKWQLLDAAVSAQRFRIRAESTTGAAPEFSLSEIELGVNLGAYPPYYYGDTISGRININTAPWYVINQLPWLEDDTATEPSSIAQAIVAFRDKNAAAQGGIDYSGGRANVTGIDPTDIDEDQGFKNIGQLMQVVNQDALLADFDIRKNIFDGADAVNGDYTPDTAVDDFEERNLLFHRISNLVTVRSDVFTAYILVRIGEKGPQRRMIAILDRSGVNSPDDKPKILALHPVPNPR